MQKETRRFALDRITTLFTLFDSQVQSLITEVQNIIGQTREVGTQCRELTDKVRSLILSKSKSGLYRFRFEELRAMTLLNGSDWNWQGLYPGSRG